MHFIFAFVNFKCPASRVVGTAPGSFWKTLCLVGGVDQITAKQLLLVPGEGLEKIVGPTGGLQPVANVLPAGL